MKTSWRSASLAATAVSVMALTAACGSDNAPTPSSAAQNVGATAAAGGYGSVGAATSSPSTGAGNGYGADGQQAAAAEPAGQLTVANNPDLGKVLSDGAGLTLYRFDADTANPPSRTATATVPPPGRRFPRTTPRPAPVSTRLSSAR